MKEFDTNGDFANNYKFLIGSILPRPIAWISTKNENGSNNLAPFSFFTAVSAKPMIIGFSPMIRTSTGLRKDTYLNIQREKEFVVNFVTESLANKCNLTSTELAYGEDEFKLAGLTPIDSIRIKAKRVKESPIHFECILRDILDYGSTAGAGSFITGEVIKVHIDEKIMIDGKIQTDLFSPIARGAGNDWILSDHKIELDRLTKVQIQK